MAETDWGRVNTMHVNMEQLTRTIELVRENIKNKPDYDSYNEARTREALIAPVLASLGWNVADFSLVDVEYPVNRGEGQHMVDYALWNPAHPRKSQQDRPFVLVESKGIDHDLNDPSTLKGIRHYAFRAGVPYVVLTNGKIWQSHVFPSAVISEHRQVLEGVDDVDIYDASIPAEEAAKNLKVMFEKVLGAPVHHLDAGWICLKQYLDPKWEHRRQPSGIRFPDGDERETTFWSQLVSHTAGWLHKSRGYLVPPILTPILRHGKASALLVSSGEDGPNWQKIGDENLCVWAGGGQQHTPDNTGVLLSACNIDLEDVYLQVPR